MRRLLRYNFANIAIAKQSEKKYLIFPVKFPIFPHEKMPLPINKFLRQYIFKKKITLAAAVVIKPGVSVKQFKPTSYQHCLNELNLIQPQQKSQDQQNKDLLALNSNKLFIQDSKYGRIQQQQKVYYIDNVRTIFDIASKCLIEVGYNNFINLSCVSTLQMNLNDIAPAQVKKPLLYLTGKQIQNKLDSSIDIKSDKSFEDLKAIYYQLNLQQRLRSYPNSQMHNMWRLCKYLRQTQIFTPMQQYKLLSMRNGVQKADLLISYFSILEKENQKFKLRQNQSINAQLIQKRQEYKQKLYNMVLQNLNLQKQNAYIEKVKSKLLTGQYPQQVKEIINEQLENLKSQRAGFELHDAKRLIEMLLKFPFQDSVKQSIQISEARKILEQQHYGMKKVKERILQIISVIQLTGNSKSKVLLLHGPPGVGKTSIVKSIAKCLNRPFQRISLGGEYDAAIIKGHRKTYIGSYPGKIFTILSKVGVNNPIILLDQVDKIANGQSRGNLQDAFLNILDPVQHQAFRDDYAQIQIDLSNVLFICTANQLDTIFPPLLDRLEQIQVSGYVTQQKQEIFKQYIMKQCLDQCGIPQQIGKDINFSEDSLKYLIQWYCKQPGVRGLIQKTNIIFQKIAYKYLHKEQFQKTISKEQIKKYLGLSKYPNMRLYEDIPQAGIMVGLSYNSQFGGNILYIQSCITNKKSKEQIDQNKNQINHTFDYTGNIHDVMKQSCQIAFSYAKFLLHNSFNNNFLELNDVRLNFPLIQTGKDGPSAGMAITSCLISLALNKPAIIPVAMTGEINLSGKVTAIGGVKAKMLGAKNNGIVNLIFPQENRKDVEEIQPELKQGMNIHFVQQYSQAMQIIFGIKI